MRLRYLSDLFYRLLLGFSVIGLFILLSACGTVPTTSEPTALTPTIEISEAVATLSLPTFTVVLPTSTVSQPTNTIPLPTLTQQSSETPGITPSPETTPTLEATSTSEPTSTSEAVAISETSEVNATATTSEEPTVTIAPSSEPAGTATSTIALPTFTPQPGDTSVPLPTETALIPTRTQTATPTEIPLVVTATSTEIPVVPTPLPTDVPLVATSIPTNVPPVSTPIPTDVPPVATSIPTNVPPVATPIPTDVPLVATSIPTDVPIEVTPSVVTPDTDENPPDTFFAALPLDTFTALPTLENIDYSQINPAQTTQYWELRFAFPGETSEVIGSGGSREGIDAALLAEFDILTAESGFDVQCMPAYCFKYVVSIRDNQIQTWQTVEELKVFLGPIDRVEEAILFVAAHEYGWSNEAGKETGSFRMIADGYEFIVLQLVDDCDPVQTDRFFLNMTTSGTLTIQHSSIWTQYMGMCI